MKRILPISCLSVLFFKMNLLFGQCATIIAAPATILDCGMASAKIVPQIVAGATPINSLIYQWSTPPASYTGPLNQSTLVANAEGIYTLVVSDPNTTCVATATMAIVFGQLTANASAFSTIGSPNTVNFINLSSSTLGSNNITTTWSFANGQSSVTAYVSVSPVINYSSGGTYVVTLHCTKGACVSTFSLNVYPGMPNQNFVGLKECELNSQNETTRYFDLSGKEQVLEKNKVLIEQKGSRRRKVIMVE